MNSETQLPPMPLHMPVPTGDQLKAARVAAGLSQAQAAELMGYPLQTGSRGGVQSRTWQALESTSDERNMQGPVFAMFLLLTGQHPGFCLIERPAPDDHARSPESV
ncbi:XRE family transcriptional regulator [Acidovorax facilis]|uniref:XRE family transcriptional regulator n=1 Tax=Acidovorax facilis TaxID=12917 RepID=UPI003CF728DE